MSICVKVAKEQKQWSRNNGWSLPLHPLQVSAWFFLVMFAFLYFGALVPNMPEGAWQISGYIINGSVFLFHIVIHVISVSLNPADFHVRAKANKGPLPSFDRTKHSHVIENEYCHICEVKVGRRSKHCSACNKCVSEFDHHCKWLNNCVGGRNYRLFISCVSSALCGSLIICVSSIGMIVAYFKGSNWLFRFKYLDQKDPSVPSTVESNVTEGPILFSTPDASSSLNVTSDWGTQTLLCMQIHGTIWITIVFITAALSLLAVALLAHLLGFHIFLMCQNFASTYDYIVYKRNPPSAQTTKEDKGHRSTKFDCHSLLQHVKSKKGNQISPKTQENGKSDDIEEWEMQPSAQNKPDSNRPTIPMPVVSESKCTVSTDDDECPLDNYVGNVYIGSPHRRRHYLEPINMQQKSASPENKAFKESHSKSKDSTIETEDKDEDSLTDTDSQSSCSSLAQVVNHGNAQRRLHRTPSPAPLLSPILESEISSGSAIVSWKHRSVSEQSLHTLVESEEDSTTASLDMCTVQVDPPLNYRGAETKDDSGSLSNFFLPRDKLEDTEEDNNNTLTDDDDRVHEVCIMPRHEDPDNRVREVFIKPQREDVQDLCTEPRREDADSQVHEVCIKPQREDPNMVHEVCIKPQKEDRDNNAIEVIANVEPVVNGEVWAYSSKCHLKDGVISFKRSCSMQENEHAKNSDDPLTRCSSEDELKSKMTKLQRRVSEDRDLWMIRGGGCNSIPQMWREHSPKAGVSATAVFCVEEPEESFRIPGIPFGLKRKYNHFSVPNHIVLPCSNSVHPESRKRTRPVGSKPPKAFHA